MSMNYLSSVKAKISKILRESYILFLTKLGNWSQKRSLRFSRKKKHNIFLFKKEILRVEHDNGLEIKVDGTY